MSDRTQKAIHLEKDLALKSNMRGSVRLYCEGCTLSDRTQKHFILKKI